MRKNPNCRIVKGKSKKQYLCIIPKSCYYQIIIKNKKRRQDKEVRQRKERITRLIIFNQVKLTNNCELINNKSPIRSH